MARLLSLDEIKHLQIEMLKEFDRFCRANDITYFLSYGTLLGAIRHKGYIPWDDDIDVMVPRDQIDRLKSIYKSNRYKIADIDNEPNYEFPYPRLIDTHTYQKCGFTKKYGVNIDIYVIDAFPEKEEERLAYIENLNRIRAKRLFLIRVRNKLFKLLPIKRFPFIKRYTNQHETLLKAVDYKEATTVFVFDHISSPLLKEWFKSGVEVDFEGSKMMAPIGWHQFLSTYYGNYMELPPEDKRIPYHNNVDIYIR